MGLTEPLPEKEDNFGIELTEDVGSTLREVLCTEELLQRGRHIRELSLPEGTLVIMIKRGDRYIVPNGSLELMLGDRLLLMIHNV